MKPRIAILLGRTIWIRNVKGWQRKTFGDCEGVSRLSIVRLGEILSADPAERTVIVFEPEGIAHQTVETPRVSRAEFATLERVRKEHPVVLSENLGWGIEYPEPGSSGTYWTLIHSEMTPGLAHLRDACNCAGGHLPAAWSAYTAAVACATPGSAALKTRSVLLLTPDFTAIATFGGGKRSFKGLLGSASERDWKALSVLIGDSEARPSPTMVETGLKRGSIIVVADGEPEQICPIWKDLRASGRIEAIMNLDEFATSVAQIPWNHPANLVEAFPRPRNLDRFLAAAAIAGVSATVALGAISFGNGEQLRAGDAADHAQAANLELHLKQLNANQREMDRLRAEIPDGSGSLPVGRYEALIGLAAAIPDALTLTSLTIRREGEFELEARVVGADFDPEGTRQSLLRCGFGADTDRGWVYDVSSGRLLVRGKYSEPLP